MQNEYYGVASTPTQDYLAHYGVKGMKWGIRRALSSRHADRALAKQYKKAERKLAKLSKRADIEVQKQNANKLHKISKISRRVGHVGAIAGGLSFPYENQAEKLYTQQYNRHFHDERYAHRNAEQNLNNNHRTASSVNEALYKSGALSSSDYMHNKHTYDANYENDYKKLQDTWNAQKAQNKLDYEARDRRVKLAKVARVGGIGLAALGYGTAIGSKVAEYNAKKRATSKGHAKAVAKRDAWANEMNKAFAGTKYSKKHRR